jgi:four helix bundle protein
VRIRDHTKLDVWRLSCDLVADVYRLTQRLPRSELFGLTSQMRRAAVSIPSNIAEGASRGSQKDFARYLNIAAGSAGELDTQVHIAEVLGLVTPEEANPVRDGIARVRRMLVGLIRALGTPDETHRV